SALADPRPLPPSPPRRSSDLELVRLQGNHVKLHMGMERATKLRALAAINPGGVGLQLQLINPPRNHIQFSSQARHPKAMNHIGRSEEHTSELQSRENLVCRLL